MALNRRDFLASTAGLAAAGVAGGGVKAVAADQPENVIYKPNGKPVAIASSNGLGACARAMELLKAGGDPVDAAVAGVNLVEDDPEDHSVGYGGLPNEDGIVECDACVMHGPRHKGGAVAALRNIRNASSVAKIVMQRTDHVLLVGEGALRFARAHGFKEQEMLTEEARRIWLKWKETHSDKDDWIHPEADVEAARSLGEDSAEFTHGTISCLTMTPSGDLGGCTTTSGLSYKIPGRVGDSPVFGAGLYVDNVVGAAGSTGRGEANLLNCSSFLVVELMRHGATPDDACRQVLRRVAGRTEPRLLEKEGYPAYQLKLYAIRKDGRIGGACMRGDREMAVNDGGESRLVTLKGLFPPLPEPPNRKNAKSKRS